MKGGMQGSLSRLHWGLIFIQGRQLLRLRIPLFCSAAADGFLTLGQALGLRVERGGLRLVQGQLP